MHSVIEQIITLTSKDKYTEAFCYPNPIQKDNANKELCDLLIVFGGIVGIISIKEIKEKIPKENDKFGECAWARWKKAAIDESIQQLHGAERYIEKKHAVFEKGKKKSIPIPNNPEYFRIAIALGSRGEKSIPLDGKTAKDKFVHIVNESLLQVLFKEIDTLPDFFHYFREREKLLRNIAIDIKGEQNLLACYLLSGDNFDDLVNQDKRVFIKPHIYAVLRSSPRYKRFQMYRVESYRFDELIKRIISSEQPRDFIERYVYPLTRLCRDKRIAITKGIDELRIRDPIGCYHAYLMQSHSVKKQLFVIMSAPFDAPRDEVMVYLERYAFKSLLTFDIKPSHLPIDIYGLGVLKSKLSENTPIALFQRTVNNREELQNAAKITEEFDKKSLWEHAIIDVLPSLGINHDTKIIT